MEPTPSEHRHGDIDRRWTQAALQDDGRLGMCLCCAGPLKLDGFDAHGIGYGFMLCSRCC